MLQAAEETGVTAAREPRGMSLMDRGVGVEVMGMSQTVALLLGLVVGMGEPGAVAMVMAVVVTRRGVTARRVYWF